jgi:hypothetical protein
MLFWLIANDFKHSVEAPSLEAAFQQLAQDHGYDSFPAFCAELGYGVRSFEVVVIRDGRDGRYDKEADRAQIKAQGEGATLNAWKQLRRLAIR